MSVLHDSVRSLVVPSRGAVPPRGAIPSPGGAVAPARAVPRRALAPSWRPEGWMGALNPSLRLDELTIPGTHDSGARYGGRWVACQSATITEQLRMGVRYLDVRVRLHRGHLDVHHNQWFQRLRLDDVLAACQDFLDDNPTESVVACLTEEYSRSRPAELAAAWQQVRREFTGLVHDARRVPTLAQARGRVVVATRSPGVAGLDHAAWQVHDDWHIGTRQCWESRKWPGVTDHLRRARAARGDGRLWSCHATSNGWNLPPVAAAQLLAPRLAQHLAELPERPAPGAPERNTTSAPERNTTSAPERNGIVLLDFVEPAQAAQLVARNF